MDGDDGEPGPQAGRPPGRRASFFVVALVGMALLGLTAGAAMAVIESREGAGPGPGGPAPPPADPSEGCGRSEARAGDDVAQVTSGGDERTYLRQVPPAHDGTDPVPLVVDLHGYGEPALAHADYTGLGRFGAEAGFVTLTPQASGEPPAWDAGTTSRDVTFVRDLLDEAERTLCIDTHRVYVAGLSNGAMLASTLACVEAGRIAAVAAVAGVSPVVQAGGVPAAGACRPDRPVPLVAFHGTDDPVIRFDGGFGPGVLALPGPDGTPIGARQARADLTVPQVMAVWAERYGCDPEPPQETSVAEDVRLASFDCPPGAAVDLYVVSGGRHGWPGSSALPAFEPLASAVGRFGATTDVSANALMWSFFESHPRPPA